MTDHPRDPAKQWPQPTPRLDPDGERALGMRLDEETPSLTLLQVAARTLLTELGRDQRTQCTSCKERPFTWHLWYAGTSGHHLYVLCDACKAARPDRGLTRYEEAPHAASLRDLARQAGSTP